MNTNHMQHNEINNLSDLDISSNSSVPESLETAIISDSPELITETNAVTESSINEYRRNIIDHLEQSNGNLSYFSQRNAERASQIREHIQKSLSQSKA